MNRRTAFALSALLFAAPVVASAGALYKCSNEGGGTTYTNNKDGYRNCVVVSRDGPAASASPAPSRSKAGGPSPTDFPRVSGDAQKGRDNDRQRILEQEVAAEQKGLDEARKSLAEQEAQRATAERLQTYRDRVALHTRNLDALRRELGKLK